MKIILSTDSKKLEGKLNELMVKQLPFALSAALNVLTSDIRDKDLGRLYGNVFERRNNQFFKLTHDIRNSSKRQWSRYGAVISSIQPAEERSTLGMTGRAKKTDTSFMNLHVTGGTRRPLRKKKAVPITNSKYGNEPLGITRSKKTGKVTNARKASTLYNKPRSFMVGKGDNSVLMVRVGRGKGSKTKAAYNFRSSVENDKKYSPLARVRSGMRTRANQAITRGVVKAFSSARLRLS